MLYFSSYNSFGNNWDIQQQSLGNLPFPSQSSELTWLFVKRHLNQIRAHGLTKSEGGTLAPLNPSFFLIPPF